MRRSIASLIVAIAGLSCSASGGTVPATEPQARASEDSLTGTFHTVYGERERYFLVMPGESASTELVFLPSASGDSIGVIGYDRRQVTVIGHRDRQRSRLFHVRGVRVRDVRAPIDGTAR